MSDNNRIVPEGWEVAHCVDPLVKGCTRSWPRPVGSSTACTCGATIPPMPKLTPEQKTALEAGESAYIITDRENP